METLRRAYAAFARGDWEAVFADADPEITYEFPEGGFAEGSVFRGREAVLGLWRRLSETFSEWRSEPERYLEAGDDVLVFVREAGKGGLSDVEFQEELAHIWTFREGRVVRFRVFQNRGRACRAVGLDPP
jgi:ketosteroid isomerase-like protein